MKKIFTLFILLFLTLVKSAFANLSISPFYLHFDANSSKRIETVRFTNVGTEKKTYRIQLINYRQLSDGQYQLIQEQSSKSLFASPYLNYSPHETVLEPQQSQTIRIQRKPMAAAADGEYVSHLLIQEMPNPTVKKASSDKTSGIRIDIKALYGVTIPIIIEKGKLIDQAVLADIKQINKNTISATIQRKGNRSFWGTLIILDGKKEIGRVNEFKIFLTTPQRVVQVPLTQQPSGKIKIILKDARTNAVIMEKTI